MVKFMEKIYYHGTFFNKPILTFKYNENDIGFHFGTLKQAQERIYDKNKNVPGYIYKYKLNINKSLRLPDLSNFNYKTIMHELKVLQFDITNYTIKSNQDMRTYLNSKGFDSIVYVNEKEIPEARELIIENNSILNKIKSDKHISFTKHTLYKDYKIINQRLNLVTQYFAEDSILILNTNNINYSGIHT